jgi:hypothetical protein
MRGGRTAREEGTMKSRSRSTWIVSIAAAAVLVALAASAGTADATRPAPSKPARIVPVATPVDLNPCAFGGC